jgi:hypothetical protein
MKIFSKFYVRRLYRTRTLNEVLSVLDSWIDEVLYRDSPFLQQIASHFLRKYGSSYAPRFFKRVLGNEILRLNHYDDLRSCVILAIIESYRDYNPAKGNITLVNWLSWRIPYEVHKLVTLTETKIIVPVDIEFKDPMIERMEDSDYINHQIDIVCSDLCLGKQVRYSYKQKRKDSLCYT